MTNAWHPIVRSRPWRWFTAIAVLSLIGTLVTFSRFLLWIETRPGVVIADPILQSFAPMDCTWLTFAGIYGGLLLTALHLVRFPVRFLQGLVAYTILLLFRFLTLWLLPLDPPPTMIVLADPIVEWLGTGGIVLQRDLFFSGHTAGLTLLTLLAVTPQIRRLLTSITVIVAAALIVQHVHYSIDVICAPFFAYAAYRVSQYIVHHYLPSLSE